ncbi:MAG: site-2 protease family protein [Patescibacteria group bacterium]
MGFFFSFLGLILAITIHEFAHALAADRLGDPTPRAAGRLTLNPLSHLDPLGTIMIFFASFGWGRPVPIDPYNFSSPRRDELLVALAGPASNLFLGSLLGIIHLTTDFYHPILQIIALTNFSLGVFNLLPLPPLDGSKIFLNLIPIESAIKWREAFDRYGYFLIAIFLFLPFAGGNLISFLVSPPVNFLYRLFF